MQILADMEAEKWQLTWSVKQRPSVASAENYGAALTPDLLKIWLRLLRPYPPEFVEAAAVRVIETYAYKTMPPYAVRVRPSRK